MPDSGLRKGDWRLAPQSNQLLHLDMLRFFAASAIVLSHSQHDLGFRSDGFGIFVDLFFLISGFVIAFVYAERLKDADDYRAFLLRRIARLGPLHWATLAVFVVLSTSAQVADVHINAPEAFDLRCLPANAAMLHATGLCPHYSFNGPSWSISAEMAMYAATPLIFALLRRPLSGLVAIVTVWVALTALAGDDWLSWTTNGGVLRALPSFLVGVLLYYQRHRLAAIPRASWLCIAALLALFFGAALSLPHIWLIGLAYAAGAFGIAADLRAKAPAAVRRIAPLGQLTYSAYMLHPLLLVVARFAADSLIGGESTIRTAFMVTAVLLTFPLSYLSFVLFETPSRRRITRAGEQWLNRRRSGVGHEAAA